MLNGKRMALFALAVFSGIALAQIVPPGNAPGLGKTSVYKWSDPIADVLVGVNDHFYKEPDLKAMQRGAIRGMIEALDDPYTEFVPTEDTKLFDKAIRGEYVGIGAEVRAEGGWLAIASPLDDSPAYKAGVEADDLVVGVDGRTTWRRDVDDIIDHLTGEPGTTVTVTIERKGDETDRPQGALPPSTLKPWTDEPAKGAAAEKPASDKPAPKDAAPAAPDADTPPDPKPGSFRFDLKIVRQKIVTSTVKGIHRVGDSQEWDFMGDPANKIGYIRVTQFTGGTTPELKAACEKLISQGMRGLILDLRFNGGGSLQAAIEMADLFLPEGVIVSTKGRKTKEEKALAHSEGTLPDFPMAVLLNESSASASEVLSGALVDNHRAIAIGTRSFGKGIVQTVYRVPSGEGQLKVTEAYYYLPSGRCLHRTPDSTEWGVDPTPGFYVPMDTKEQREMFRIRRADEVIRAKGKPGDTGEQKWEDHEWILQHLKDRQLSAAMKALQLRLEKGEWTPTGAEAPKGTLELAELQREQRRFELLERELDRSARRIEALSNVADAKAPKPFEPIPGEPDLTGGKLLVYDKDGKVVATLKITGPDLDRWLIDAPVESEHPTP